MTVQELTECLRGLPPQADVECNLTGDEDPVDMVVAIEGAKTSTCPIHDPGADGTVVIFTLPASSD
jgi:hypothetical protein